MIGVFLTYVFEYDLHVDHFSSLLENIPSGFYFIDSICASKTF